MHCADVCPCLSPGWRPAGSPTGQPSPRGDITWVVGLQDNHPALALSCRPPQVCLGPAGTGPADGRRGRRRRPGEGSTRATDRPRPEPRLSRVCPRKSKRRGCGIFPILDNCTADSNIGDVISSDFGRLEVHMASNGKGEERHIQPCLDFDISKLLY